MEYVKVKRGKKRGRGARARGVAEILKDSGGQTRGSVGSILENRQEKKAKEPPPDFSVLDNLPQYQRRFTG